MTDRTTNEINQLPPAVDLSAVRDELIASNLCPSLADNIRRALVAQSCVADLREADDCRDALQALLSSPRKVGTRQRDSTEMALMTIAVLLYARATSTSGQKGERGSIQITAHLSTEQLDDHDALVATRNRALAHVYPNEEVGGRRWHNAAVLLLWEETGWRPGAASNRIQLDRQLLARLTRQLPVATAIVTAATDKRFRQLAEAVSAAMTDEALLAILDRCRLDLTAFFGTLDAARAAVASASADARRGLTTIRMTEPPISDRR